MIGLGRVKIGGGGGAKAAAVLALATLAACSGSARFGSLQPEPPSAPLAPAAVPAPPPAPPIPPVDLSGRWKLSAAAGACLMTLGDAPGASQGTIAPEGGCPESFFTSRKWTFEHAALIIRDHRGKPLAQLAFSGNRFEGTAADGAALTLSRPQ